MDWREVSWERWRVTRAAGRGTTSWVESTLGLRQARVIEEQKGILDLGGEWGVIGGGGGGVVAKGRRGSRLRLTRREREGE